MATLQSITDNGNTTTNNLVLKNPTTDDIGLTLSAGQDTDIYDAILDNASLNFSRTGGTQANYSSAHAELYDGDTSKHVIIQGDITILENSTDMVMIRNGNITVQNKANPLIVIRITSNIISRNYASQSAAKSAGLSKGDVFHTNGALQIVYT